MRNPVQHTDGRFGRKDLDLAYVKQLADEGKSRTEICRLIGCDPKVLRRFLAKHGINPARGAMGGAAVNRYAPPAVQASNPLWTAWRA
jgi:hypothetical protein